MYKKSSVFSTEDCYRTLELVRRRIPFKIHINTSSQSSSKNHAEEVLVLSEIKDLKEATKFIDVYETVSQSNFHTISSKHGPNRSFCSRKWICNHGVVSGLNKACPASISILIKTFNNESMLQDDLLQKESPFPAVIRINPNHNHRLIIPLPPYKLSRINNDVKMCFYEYFKRGYFGGRAKQFHQQYLRKAKFRARNDESMNPTVKAIYTLANIWLKMKESVEVDKVRKSCSNVQVEAYIQSSLGRSKLHSDHLSLDYERLEYSPAGKKQNEAEKSSLQNIDNIDYVVANLKKEPDDEYIIPENSVNEILEPQTIFTIKEEIVDEDENENSVNEILEPQTILTIKQEIVDEDENDGFPVISSEQSSQNLDNFMNIDIVAKLKKEPGDEYTSAQTQNSINEIQEIQPVLTVKQEITDEDEAAGLPVISSYGSLAVPSPPTLPLNPSIVNTSIAKRTAKTATKGASAVGKVVQASPSQVVVYGLSPNTYKVVKRLSVNSGTFSACQYKSYSPSVLAPMRISLQKF